jgi:hypothetical protein
MVIRDSAPASSSASIEIPARNQQVRALTISSFDRHPLADGKKSRGCRGAFAGYDPNALKIQGSVRIC